MATDKVSRVIDSLDFGEQSNQTTAATTYNINDWGDTSGGQINIDDNLRVIPGMNNSPAPSKVISLSRRPTGNLSFIPSSLTFFKYFAGDYSDDGTNYTINNTSSSLPTALTVRGNVNESERIRCIGSYFNNLRISLADEDVLTCSSDFIYINEEPENGTVSYTAPTNEPLIYSNGVFTLNGTEMDLQNINLTFDPRFIQKYGIRSASSNQENPSQILRGSKFQISFDGTANLTGAANNELEQLLSAGNATIVLTFTKGSDTHTITIEGRIGNKGLSYTDSEENSKTVTFNGQGNAFSVTGTL